MNFSQNKLAYSALAFVILTWSYFYFFKTIDMADANEVGDAFGSLNTLFTGLAFVGLIWTIGQQSKQLKVQENELKNNTKQLEYQKDELVLTRKEMEQNREELVNSNSELKGQKLAIQHQNFQNHLFGLLNLYKLSINSLSKGGSSDVETGVSALITLSNRSPTNDDPRYKRVDEAKSSAEASKIYSDIHPYSRLKIDFIAPKLEQMIILVEEFLRSANPEEDSLVKHNYYDAILIGISQTEIALLEAYLFDVDSYLIPLVEEYYSNF